MWKNTDFCQHNDKEQMLTGTWTTTEIDKVIVLGYRLTKVTEVWHFKNHSDSLFSSFINALYKGKLEVSGYPNNVVTTEEKLK